MSLIMPIFHIPIELIEKEIKNKSDILTERDIERYNRIIFIDNSQFINTQRSQRVNNNGNPN